MSAPMVPMPVRRLTVVSSASTSVGGSDPVPTRPRATMDGIGRVRNLFALGAPTNDPSGDDRSAGDHAGDHTGDPVADSLRRAGRGDEAAFAEFYRHTSSMVHGTVLKILRDPAMSEEVTQEVFVELWRLAPRFDADRGSARSWAATIAHRRAVDRVRSEQSSRDREVADSRRADRRADDLVDGVVDEVVDRLDRTRVVEALDQLTDAQREAVTLAYYGGHTYREVAVLLGVPEGTIKTRIRDGLIKLRDLMGVAS